MVTLTDIGPVHRFDEKRLADYLQNQNLDDFSFPMLAQQFQGGNPIQLSALKPTIKDMFLEKNLRENYYHRLI